MARASDWLPIDTAPKDGTDILVWVPMGSEFRKPDYAFAIMANWSGRGWSDSNEGIRLAPSHWQPVEPPVSTVEFVPVDEIGTVRGRVFYGPSPFAAASAAELLGRSVIVNGETFDVAGVERQAKLPASIAIGEPIGLLLRPSR